MGVGWGTKLDQNAVVVSDPFNPWPLPWSWLELPTPMICNKDLLFTKGVPAQFSMVSLFVSVPVPYPVPFSMVPCPWTENLGVGDLGLLGRWRNRKVSFCLLRPSMGSTNATLSISFLRRVFHLSIRATAAIALKSIGLDGPLWEMIWIVVLHWNISCKCRYCLGLFVSHTRLCAFINIPLFYSQNIYHKSKEKKQIMALFYLFINCFAEQCRRW